MPRRSSPDLSTLDDQALWDRLTPEGRDALSLDDQFEIIQTLRPRGDEWAARVDRWLLGQAARLRAGLDEARAHHHKLERLLDELSSPPWMPGVHLGTIETERGIAACVSQGLSVRIVGISDNIRPQSLEVGDQVLLNRDLTTVMCQSSLPMMSAGETVIFDRILADGRLVVKHRDEELVVRAAARLDVARITRGDTLRWDRALGLVFEKIDRAREGGLFVEEMPRDGFETIGGLDEHIERLQRSLRLHMQHADVVRKYRLRRAGSVLLVGPPGTGKTLLARGLANWLGRHSRSGRAKFLPIKPAALHSMWYSASEANYREVFRVAREAAEADPDTPVVLFFDEVDSIGAARGTGTVRIDDRVLTSFMTELDGFESRGNVLIVAATNRRDAVDPGLIRPGRLGDIVIPVSRPNMAAAASILGKHLPSDIPYAGDAESAAARRDRVIAAAVSRLYAPNGEGEVATIVFRDNSRRPVHAREIVSGASLANIARAAIESACQRDVASGEEGVRLTDVLDAVADEVDSAVGVLTPVNCHTFVSGLPQDLAVARVEPRARTLRRPHRFTSAA